MAGVTVIEVVVAPVLQEYVPPPVPVRVADAPTQMMPLFGVVPEFSVTVIPGVGSGFTVIVVEVDVEQLFAFVTVTV